jgi:tetratricopeptide (TPR) repeat protein|tara:strand:+ start:746 stop:1573 length:828 start_codon:yes stop_codon:yes gene_type:complete
MILIPAFVFLIAASAAEVHLTSEQQSTVLSEAQTAYDNAIALQTSDPVASIESFRRSANRFQLLVDDGIENGKLWYDLGNAQLQSGEIGEAIAAYRSAKRYIPYDGRVTTNLDYARSLVTDPVASENSFSILNRLAFWHESLPTQVRIAIGITFWIAFWTLVSIRFFRTIPVFKSTSIIFGLGSIALGASVSIDFADQHLDNGVLTAQEVIVRKGNGMNFAPVFQDPIHEGIEFEILGRRSNWLHIRLPSGPEGWIQEEDAQIVTLDSALTGKHI